MVNDRYFSAALGWLLEHAVCSASCASGTGAERETASRLDHCESGRPRRSCVFPEGSRQESRHLPKDRRTPTRKTRTCSRYTRKGCPERVCWRGGTRSSATLSRLTKARRQDPVT